MRLLLALITLTATGCVTTPNLRVGQDKVRPPVVDRVTEGIRQAADYLDTNVTDGKEAIVADALAERVGPPNVKLSSERMILNELRSDVKQYRKELKEINEWLAKRQGTKLENTGFNLAGPLGVLSVFLLIGILILFPALIPLVLQIVQLFLGEGRKHYRQALSATVDTIEELKSKHSDGSDIPQSELFDLLSKKQGTDCKKLVGKCRMKK